MKLPQLRILAYMAPLLLAACTTNAQQDDQLDCSFQGALELLEGGAVTLKHVVNPYEGTMTVEMTYNGIGWVSFGTSPQGTMVGGQVVTAKPDEPVSETNPAKYEYTSSGFALMSRQTLSNATFEQTPDGKTILRYTKLLSEPDENEIFTDGPNTFIWGVGTSNSYPAYHQFRGSPTFPQLTMCQKAGASSSSTVDTGDAMTNSTETSTTAADAAVPVVEPQMPKTDYRNLWLVHGWLMAISWAIVIPFAIGSSLLRSLVPGDAGNWLRIHMTLNGVAFILMTAGFAIAVYIIQRTAGTGHFKRGKHGTIGLVIYLISFIQMCMGYFRPSLPHPPQKSTIDNSETKDTHHDVSSGSMSDDGNKQQDHAGQKSLQRRLFEIAHRLFGLGLLGLAWYNCYTGIRIIIFYYGEEYDRMSALWGTIGGISGTIAVVTVVQRTMIPKSKTNTSSTNEEIEVNV